MVELFEQNQALLQNSFWVKTYLLSLSELMEKYVSTMDSEVLEALENEFKKDVQKSSLQTQAFEKGGQKQGGQEEL